MAVLVIVKQSILPLSQFYAGPISTSTAMVIATALLWKRGSNWSRLGLRWPQSWKKTIILTAVTFFAIVLSGNLMGWLAGFFFEDVGTSGRFDHIRGDLAAYLVTLLIVWTHSAIFEELLFRAFILDRASAFLPTGPKYLIVAALFGSIFFGYRHYYYQGINGAFVTGAIGFSLSLLYFWFGRKNILPLILAHGLVNTIGMTNRFLGSPAD